MPEHSAQSPASTSRAVQCESFGGPEALILRDGPAPQAGRHVHGKVVIDL